MKDEHEDQNRPKLHCVGVGVALALAVALLAGCGGGPDSPTDTPSGRSSSRPERHITLDGQPNFRDLGGYRTADGRTVMWGQIYRSGELGQGTEEDVATLESLELRTVVNFLLPEEIEKSGLDRLPEGTRNVPMPISSERAAELTRQVQDSIRTADFGAIPPELNPEFHRILLDDGKEQYAALLRVISDPANRPLAFHCSHGIHRTGTAAAILLSALGVPWETIRTDYLLSNEYRREEIGKQLDRVRRTAAESQGISPEDVDMTNVEAFYILDGTYIDALRDEILDRYGSMEGYLRAGLGLADEELRRLRNELLE